MASENPGTVRLWLELERDSDPLSGSIGDAPGTARRFSGWLALMSNIAAAAGSPGDADTLATPRPGRDGPPTTPRETA